MKPYIVTFAGVPGSSKSIVAHHLSYRFNLPIFSNDIVRWEVREDLRVNSINIPEALAEYEKRKNQRKTYLVAKGKSLILDASADRTWAELKGLAASHDYATFVISMDLSKQFMTDLYLKTDRDWAVKQLDDYHSQHQGFLDNFSKDVNLHITDEQFPNRLDIAAEGLQLFLSDLRKSDNSTPLR